MQAFGLYTHIRANRVRSAFLLGALFLLLYVLVFAGALAYQAFAFPDDLDRIVARAFADLVRAAPWATLAGLIWIAIAYRFNQSIIAMVTGSRGVTRQEAPQLYNALENLCISRGLAVPRLDIMEADELNAYATGLNEKQYAITLTRGLVETLDQAELEAVLGHELTHIRNGDVRLMVIAGVMAGIIAFFGELLFRFLTNSPRISYGSGPSHRSSSGDGRKASGGAFAAVLIAAALIAVSWFLSQFIKFALSRSREYLADAGSVELTKNPDAMISALQKIAGRGELPNVPSGLMELCIDNPRSGFVDLFATHPSIDSRIEALVRYAGGRVRELAAPDAVPGPWGSATLANNSQSQ